MSNNLVDIPREILRAEFDLAEMLLDPHFRDYVMECAKSYVPPGVEIGLPLPSSASCVACQGTGYIRSENQDFICQDCEGEGGIEASETAPDVFEVLDDMNNRPKEDKLAGRFAVCADHKFDNEEVKVPSSPTLWGFQYRPDRETDSFTCGCWERTRR